MVAVDFSVHLLDRVGLEKERERGARPFLVSQAEVVCTVKGLTA